MFSIIFSLLGGWILSWFGFDFVVIKGMNEFFELTVTSTGYYFMFGLIGMVRSILSFVGMRNRAKGEFQEFKNFKNNRKNELETMKKIENMFGGK